MRTWYRCRWHNHWHRKRVYELRYRFHTRHIWIMYIFDELFLLHLSWRWRLWTQLFDSYARQHQYQNRQESHYKVVLTWSALQHSTIHCKLLHIRCYCEIAVREITTYSQPTWSQIVILQSSIQKRLKKKMDNKEVHITCLAKQLQSSCTKAKMFHNMVKLFRLSCA